MSSLLEISCDSRVDAIEVATPFTDPIADRPVIEEYYRVSFAQNGIDVMLRVLDWAQIWVFGTLLRYEEPPSDPRLRASMGLPVYLLSVLCRTLATDLAMLVVDLPRGKACSVVVSGSRRHSSALSV